MVAAIDQMIEDVLAREGGFVSHPADRGGPTNRGITLPALGRHLGRPATLAELRALSKTAAAAIYRRDYYLAPRLNTLPVRVQPFLLDAAVNHGPGRAIRFLQRVCQEAGFGPLAEDGACGPRTRRAASAADQAMGAWLLAALIEERRAFYHRLVEAEPGQAVFLRGWLRRLAAFEQQIERLVA